MGKAHKANIEEGRVGKPHKAEKVHIMIMFTIMSTSVVRIIKPILKKAGWGSHTRRGSYVL